MKRGGFQEIICPDGQITRRFPLASARSKASHAL